MLTLLKAWYNEGGKLLKKEQKGLLKPKTDVVFQALFGVQGSERILGGLLSKIIDENVENIENKETETTDKE